MSGAHVISASVLTTLSAQRFVTAATASAQTVMYPAAVSQLILGVTIDTVLDTTQSIPVQLNGAAYVFFNDTAASGELVTSDTAGKAIPFALAATSTAISAPANYAGVVWGTGVVGTAQTGAVQQVLLSPGFDRVSA